VTVTGTAQRGGARLSRPGGEFAITSSYGYGMVTIVRLPNAGSALMDVLAYIDGFNPIQGLKGRRRTESSPEGL
jgi:hypothetical protein